MSMISPWQIIVLMGFALFLVPMIIALIDILGNEFTRNNKLIWVLVVLLGGVFGAILYFIMGRQHKLPKS